MTLKVSDASFINDIAAPFISTIFAPDMFMPGIFIVSWPWTNTANAKK